MSFEEPWNTFMRNHAVFRSPTPRDGESSFRRKVKLARRKRNEICITLFKKKKQLM